MSPDDLHTLQTVALASLLAWASGIRLYFVVFALGLASRLNYFPLPPGLQVLEHNWVLGAAGMMLLIEFITDKVPFADSVWDAVHTFIRIPAGALLAAGATGDSLSALTVAAGLLGGTITAGTHITKAASRAVINTSPEPITNWATSFTEDFAVVLGAWFALHHPVVFLAALAVVLVVTVWLLVKFWRGIGLLRKMLTPEPKPPAPGAKGKPGAPAGSQPASPAAGGQPAVAGAGGNPQLPSPENPKPNRQD
jgi:hypothetical protein